MNAPDHTSIYWQVSLSYSCQEYLEKFTVSIQSLKLFYDHAKNDQERDKYIGHMNRVSKLLNVVTARLLQIYVTEQIHNKQ